MLSTYGDEGVVTAAGRYSQLASEREPYLTRARECASLTLPALIPPDGSNRNTTFPTPAQSVGARGVNNLAAKLMLALFPANTPFFQLTINDYQLERDASGSGGGENQEGIRTEVEKALSKVERAVQNHIETEAFRPPVFEGTKHLLVAGNVLLHLPKLGARIFPLPRFVLKRDPDGNLLELITKESISPMALPDDVRKLVAAKNEVRTRESTEDTVDLYTHVRRTGPNKLEYYQEAAGVRVPESDGSCPADESPWIPLRMVRVDGESYGRSFVEEYLGDMNSLEVLSAAIVDGAAEAARVVHMVNPNGMTDAQDIQNADNGDVITGRKEDVTSMQLEKYADFRVCSDTVERIERRLEMVFLLNSAVQRSGERVTAEEIRYVASELESALGGIYSLLSQEFQLPVVSRLLDVMQRTGKLPKLPGKLIKPKITTGTEALGRGQDLNKIDALVARLSGLGPDVMSTYLDLGNLVKRIVTASGVSPEGLINDDETIQGIQQQQKVSAMVDKLGPNAINAGAKAIQAQQQQAPPQEAQQ